MELHDPHFFLPATLQRDFPSHLHIDLMRRAQGQGIGGRMIKTILAALRAKGEPFFPTTLTLLDFHIRRHP